MIEASDSETQKGLEKEDIVADSVGFILAGYDTTSTALTFATYALAANPEVQEKLADEIRDYFESNPVSSLQYIAEYCSLLCTGAWDVPFVQDKSMYDASHELQYLDMVIEETLRMYPPAGT